MSKLTSDLDEDLVQSAQKIKIFTDIKKLKGSWKPSDSKNISDSKRLTRSLEKKYL